MNHVLTRVAIGFFLLWSAVAVVIAIAAFTLTTRHNLRHDGASTATIMTPTPTAERARPRGVPADARLVSSDTTLGDTSAPAPNSANPPHLFFWLTCDDHLLTIATTQETIYAELDCSQYWLVHEVVRPYQGQPVRVRISVGPSEVLVVEATTAGAARFNVDAVWLKTR
jgi:hypothetical protein